MAKELEGYIDKKLTLRGFKRYIPELEQEHKNMPHKLPQIPAGFTALDALCYIFNNDPMPIADVMQSYVDDVPNTVDLMDALIDGIQTKSICLECVKDSIQYVHKQ